ncbi:hypothetical protein AAVH_09737, partial [Aphelenchoides avenae]
MVSSGGRKRRSIAAFSATPTGDRDSRVRETVPRPLSYSLEATFTLRWNVQ